MIRSMYSGIGGMKNFQTKLDVIGNNIANVNTYGFKKGRTTFKDLVSQQLAGSSNPTDNRGGTNPRQIGLGGTVATVDTIHTQGSLQTTGRALDLGISGDGFFIVNDGDLSSYTRAGNFYLDRQGTLVTGDGLKVQGYQPNAAGNGIDPNSFGDLTIDSGQVIPPQATTGLSFKGNLDAEAQAPNNSVTVQYKVVDPLGATHDVEIVLTKNATNAWGYAVNQVGNAASLENGNITFDGATGELLTGGQIGPITFNPTAISGAAAFNFDIDLTSLTQFAGSNTADVDEIDGNFEGFLESFNISQTGEINGVYTNGEVRILGQMGMATFNNTGGLTKAGDNLFRVSNNSGTPNVGFAGEGRGVILGSSLEMSNVDLSEEFTEMIVAQRGFQANTKMITTSDEILQELVNLKR